MPLTISRAMKTLRLCEKGIANEMKKGCEPVDRLLYQDNPFSRFLAEKVAKEGDCDAPKYDFCGDVDDMLDMDEPVVQREVAKCQNQCVLPADGVTKVEADCYVVSPVKVAAGTTVVTENNNPTILTPFDDERVCRIKRGMAEKMYDPTVSYEGFMGKFARLEPKCAFGMVPYERRLSAGDEWNCADSNGVYSLSNNCTLSGQVKVSGSVC